MLDDAIGNRHLYLPENEAMNILATYGLPVVPSVTATSPEEAVSGCR